MYVKKGFQDGMWTPDLVLTLMEPTALMIIAIAKEVGIDPVIIDPKLLDNADNAMQFMRTMGKEIPEVVKRETEGMEGLMAPPVKEIV